MERFKSANFASNLHELPLLTTAEHLDHHNNCFTELTIESGPISRSKKHSRVKFTIDSSIPKSNSSKLRFKEQPMSTEMNFHFPENALEGGSFLQSPPVEYKEIRDSSEFA